MRKLSGYVMQIVLIPTSEIILQTYYVSHNEVLLINCSNSDP